MQLITALWMGLLLAQPPAESTNPLHQAFQALRRREPQRALEALDEYLKNHPADPLAHSLRVRAHLALGQPEKALADARTVVGLRVRDADAADQLGAVLFHLGRVRDALEQFDRAISLDPARKPRHWQRGIACYYLGRWDEGARQFRAYTTVDAADVENALWHYLCVARADGHSRARQQLFPLGRDPRVPMTELYHLFAGKGTIDQVKARLGKRPSPEAGPGERRAWVRRKFYGHLYLGLFHEVHGRKHQAVTHLRQVLRCPLKDSPQYMWYVARVHLWWLEGRLKQAVPWPGGAPP